MSPIQDGGSKEEAILEAAIDEFLEKGWSGARMQAIADRASINKPLLHYYFRSKEKLYERTVQRVVETFFGNAYRAVVTPGDFDAFLREMIGVIVGEAADNPRLPLFIMQELSRGGGTARFVLRSFLDSQDQPITQTVLSRIRQASADGVIRRVNPIQFMLSLIGACMYFAMAEPVIMEILGDDAAESFDRVAFVEERKEAIYALFTRGIYKGDLE